MCDNIAHISWYEDQHLPWYEDQHSICPEGKNDPVHLPPAAVLLAGEVESLEEFGGCNLG